MSINFKKIQFLFVLLLLWLPSILFAASENNILANTCGSVLHIKNINEFKLTNDESPDGQNKAGIYALKNETNTRYLIKFNKKNGAIREFIGAFIANKIINNSAPLNYIVRINDDEFATASRFIQDFQSRCNYLDELAKTNKEVHRLYSIDCFNREITALLSKCVIKDQLIKEMYFSKKAVEANLLAKFIDHRDYHGGNVGFIIKDGKLIDFALIDFESIGGNSRPEYIPTQYFSGIDHAMQFLQLISAFDVNSLEELRPLFKELNEELFLDVTKEAMKLKLIAINKEIKACKLASEVIKGDISEENFDQLVSLHIDTNILNNLTLEDNHNTLINILCAKNDTSHIIKLFDTEQKLTPIFVNYCLNNENYKLLTSVILNADKLMANNIIKTLIMQSQTIKHLELSVYLMDKIKFYPEYFDLIKNFLNKDYNIKMLIMQHKKSEYESDNYNVAQKLMTIWLYNNKLTQLDNITDREYFVDYTFRSLVQENKIKFYKNYIGGIEFDLDSSIGYDLRGIVSILMDYGEFEILREVLEKTKNTNIEMLDVIKKHGFMGLNQYIDKDKLNEVIEQVRYKLMHNPTKK